jgi:6-phosphogluconolactonase
MSNPTRREFLVAASAAAIAASAPQAFAASQTQRVFIGSNTPDGILAYDWNPATAELAPAGVVAKLGNVDWILYSHDRRFLYASSEVDTFNGKPTGGVASYRVEGSKLTPISAQNSAARGTCYIALDHTGTVLVSADYGGGAAASFKVHGGELSPSVWSEHYQGHGPNKDRQEGPHAHSARFSPDNRFVYINDLGLDRIHIYHLNPQAAELTPAGAYHARPGAGPRMMHFHPNRVTAYSVNELDSTVDVLHWNSADGSLTLITRINLLPAGATGPTRGCDAVITRDGRHVYFANRDHNFLYAFNADAMTGALTPIARTSCGGKTPRSFTLDPTERWMLVANQDSNLIAVFARDAKTGALANEGKSYQAAAPMRILF